MSEQALIIGLVVLSLVVLIGLYVQVTKPLLEFNNKVQKLIYSVDNLNLNLSSLQENNTEAHRRIWEKNSEQDIKIENHETRISNLEKSN